MTCQPTIIKYIVKNGKEYIHYDDSKQKLYLAYLTKQLHIDENIRDWVESFTNGCFKFQRVEE